MNNGKNKGHLDNYFKEVDMFSEEHLQDIGRFNRLLESLKDPNDAVADRKVYLEAQSLINTFRNFLQKKKYRLTEKDQNELNAITGSNFAPAVKKRMLEDLVHKIRAKVEGTLAGQRDSDQAAAEIREIQEARGDIFSWFKLTLFAFDYGTITLFSHRFKDEPLTFLRKKVFEWQAAIQKTILNVLDEEYFLLSTHEYNALALLVELGAPLQRIRGIKWSLSYDPNTLAAAIDDFARAYLPILKNADVIKNAINKVFKNRQVQHGLWGIAANLIDQPIFDNKPVRVADAERMRSSITGALMSYYTSRYRVIIRTVSQLLYLAGTDGKIDLSTKHLTEAAAQKEAESREKMDSEGARLNARLIELERVVEKYLNSGKKLETRLFVLEAKSSFENWNADHWTKPLLRIKRLAEGFIKYFIDIIAGGGHFVLQHDGVEYNNYFDIKPEITDIAAGYSLADFDLAGSKAKDVVAIEIPKSTEPHAFISFLLKDPVLPNELTPQQTLARSILLKIADRSYQLAMHLNALITAYYDRKEIINPDPRYNFDFFSNALLQKNRFTRAHLVLNKESLTLQDFLETSCVIAYHIARELNHPSIEALLNEKRMLEEKVSTMASAGNDAVNIPARQQGDDTVYDPIVDNEIKNMLDELYIDTLTGLKNRKYLEDQIIPSLYDERSRYKGGSPRFVFYGMMNAIADLNKLYGHETGDRYLREISRRLREAVMGAGMDRNNIVIRYSGIEFIGYFNDISITDAVDILKGAAQEISRATIMLGDEPLPPLYASFGVCEEHQGSDAMENIDIARRLMQSVVTADSINIGFSKDMSRRITRRDFLGNDRLLDNLVSVIH